MTTSSEAVKQWIWLMHYSEMLWVHVHACTCTNPAQMSRVISPHHAVAVAMLVLRRLSSSQSELTPTLSQNNRYWQNNRSTSTHVNRPPATVYPLLSLFRSSIANGVDLPCSHTVDVASLPVTTFLPSSDNWNAFPSSHNWNSMYFFRHLVTMHIPHKHSEETKRPSNVVRRQLLMVKLPSW